MQDPPEDLWGAPRTAEEGGDAEGEPTAAMSMRQRIRLIGKAAMLQKAKDAADKPQRQEPVRKIKGLKKHIHSEQYSNIRMINKQTCFNAMLSLLLAIISVRKCQRSIFSRNPGLLAATRRTEKLSPRTVLAERGSLERDQNNRAHRPSAGTNHGAESEEHHHRNPHMVGVRQCVGSM